MIVSYKRMALHWVGFAMVLFLITAGGAALDNPHSVGGHLLMGTNGILVLGFGGMIIGIALVDFILMILKARKN